MSETIELRFGALCDPLAKQLGRPMESVAHYQADADAITRLLVRALLTSAQARAARMKLIRKMSREIQP